MLKNKKIVLAVTGGIAAYKCTFLVRLLVKEGVEVKVVMTPSAEDFVTPKSLAVLSRNPVWTSFFDNNHNWHNHVELAEWADLMLIAPLTANTLAKLSAGICDNFLLAVYYSARCAVMLAPAMDLEMYRHVSVKRNLCHLTGLGHIVVPAGEGELASGLFGEGRMAEPEQLLHQIKTFFGKNLPLQGKKALVNAGPTYEPIDPVRFIGNRSSGKMGIAIAEALAGAGAECTLVLGPSAVKDIHSSVKVVRVENSQQMHDATLALFNNSDITVCAAAVADYRPEHPMPGKIKKKDNELTLKLVRTADILETLGRSKKQGQLLAGFALETEDLEKYAREKLVKKNLDLVIANHAGDGSVFGSDHNAAMLIGKDNNLIKFEFMTKVALAEKIVDHLISLSR